MQDEDRYGFDVLHGGCVWMPTALPPSPAAGVMWRCGNYFRARVRPNWTKNRFWEDGGGFMWSTHANPWFNAAHLSGYV